MGGRSNRASSTRVVSTRLSKTDRPSRMEFASWYPSRACRSAGRSENPCSPGKSRRRPFGPSRPVPGTGRLRALPPGMERLRGPRRRSRARSTHVRRSSQPRLHPGRLPLEPYHDRYAANEANFRLLPQAEDKLMPCRKQGGMSAYDQFATEALSRGLRMPSSRRRSWRSSHRQLARLRSANSLRATSVITCSAKRGFR